MSMIDTEPSSSMTIDNEPNSSRPRTPRPPEITVRVDVQTKARLHERAVKDGSPSVQRWMHNLLTGVLDDRYVPREALELAQRIVPSVDFETIVQIAARSTQKDPSTETQKEVAAA